MRAIYKYEVEVVDYDVRLELPDGARIVHVDNQHDLADRLQFWAEVNPHAQRVGRWFRVRGTGHAYPESEETYVGTVIAAAGRLVWHLMEVSR